MFVTASRVLSGRSESPAIRAAVRQLVAALFTIQLL
jgi:hypothetical protein